MSAATAHKRHLVDITEAALVADRIKSSADAALFHEKIGLLATLTDKYLTDLIRTLAEKTDKTEIDLWQAIRRARAEQVRRNGIPMIQVNNRLLNDATGEAVNIMQQANEPPIMFRRGGSLATVQVDEASHASVIRLDALHLRSILARKMGFVMLTKNGSPTYCAPPLDLVNDFMKCGEGTFPALLTITDIPPIHGNGRIQREPGYDPATRSYYHPEDGFVLGPIADSPAQEDAARAAQYILTEMFGEFPFEGDAERANALAALVTCILRPSFGFKPPLFVFDAPSEGSGKGLMASAISVAVTGHQPAMTVLPESDAEVRKTITSLLEADSRTVLFDNVARTIRSPALASLLTCDLWSDRIMGQSVMFKGPNTAIWFAVGNNLTFAREMARRVCRIRLDPKMARPESREGFKRPDEELLLWIRENRGTIVADVLTMAKAWIMAGRPKAQLPALGNFNSWVQIVGGIITFAGVHGFLGNLTEVRTAADEESAEWELFLQTWASRFGGSGVMASQAAKFFRHPDFVELLPGDLGEDAGAEDVRGRFAKRLAKALAKKVGTRFGERELRIECCGVDGHTGVSLWRVAGNLDGLARDDGAATYTGATTGGSCGISGESTSGQ